MLTAEIPKVAKSGRYNSTRAAAALGIHRNTLRGIPEDQLPRHHFDNGDPCFLGKDILRYWFRRMVS